MQAVLIVQIAFRKAKLSIFLLTTVLPASIFRTAPLQQTRYHSVRIVHLLVIQLIQIDLRGLFRGVAQTDADDRHRYPLVPGQAGPTVTGHIE